MRSISFETFLWETFLSCLGKRNFSMSFQCLLLVGRPNFLLLGRRVKHLRLHKHHQVHASCHSWLIARCGPAGKDNLDARYAMKACVMSSTKTLQIPVRESGLPMGWLAWAGRLFSAITKGFDRTGRKWRVTSKLYQGRRRRKRRDALVNVPNQQISGRGSSNISWDDRYTVWSGYMHCRKHPRGQITARSSSRGNGACARTTSHVINSSKWLTTWPK